MGFEIEKKFLVKALPDDLERFDSCEITQGYLCRRPSIRVRMEAAKTREPHYYMTYKGLRKEGELKQEEYNLDLTGEAYKHLLGKSDGAVIEKRRYLIPLNDDAFAGNLIAENRELGAWLLAGGSDAPKIELDIFDGVFDGLVVAEVEFPSEEIAVLYHPADWFEGEVTRNFHYSNAWLSENAGEWKSFCKIDVRKV